jgi:hypothetical protein
MVNEIILPNWCIKIFFFKMPNLLVKELFTCCLLNWHTNCKGTSNKNLKILTHLFSDFTRDFMQGSPYLLICNMDGFLKSLDISLGTGLCRMGFWWLSLWQFQSHRSNFIKIYFSIVCLYLVVCIALFYLLFIFVYLYLIVNFSNELNFCWHFVSQINFF